MSSKNAGQAGKSAPMVAPKQSSPKANAPSKMHRRSRSGCFTCRLRRKKCDEGKGQCKACKHLGLKCEYKRPAWWTNNDQRKQQKENIKNIIKRTKISEKSAAQMSADTPPGLTHSLPTSASYSVTPRTRAPSPDSQYSQEYDFSQPPLHEHFDVYGQPHVLSPPYDTNPYQTYPPTPYEVDIKTERQMYVNDVPTRKDSSISTFSTYEPPPVTSNMMPFHHEAWVDQGIFEDTDVFGAEESLNFDFGYDLPINTQHSVRIDVEDCDRHLLDHFIDHVLRLIFPILELNQPGLAEADIILPALQSNKCYLHCCLSIAAIHLKSMQMVSNEQLDNDILRHRYATVAELCEALQRDTDHQQILEATLGMIFFQCSVGRVDDALPDIPWHQHFQAGTSLVRKLQLPHAMEMVHGPRPQPPFNMTLTSWIDILGATMLGRSPHFADTYREKNMNQSTSGLRELMGCDDKVMYMISEIACLDALKVGGSLDDLALCHHIKSLGEHLDTTEQGRSDMVYPTSDADDHAIRPMELSQNITAIFRLAARIYLCGLVPNADLSNDGSIAGLVARLAGVLHYIPPGFDRSLVWPLLISGSMSTPNSPFRKVFADRIACLGEEAEFGSFGRMVRLLQEVWRQSDYAGDGQNVHWRDVMQQKGWDYLLI
ncbi:hypothetical protein N7G274_007052 [Stereocaulon virgatum]|uniref:Zn(2)-C6 fungal-type domain-containing protein n=1 Tax=Stereocaulon virgatum TaxID=373712 RepID=A0ABR4A3R3_9LECA